MQGRQSLPRVRVRVEREGGKRRLTRRVPDEPARGAHPPRDVVNDLGVGKDVWEGESTDEEAARRKVAEVERGRGVGLGAEVVEAGAARREKVGERGEGEEDGCGLGKGGVSSGDVTIEERREGRRYR